MSFDRFNYNFAPRIEDYRSKFAAMGSIEDEHKNPIINDLQALEKRYELFGEDMFDKLTTFIDNITQLTSSREKRVVTGEELYQYITEGFEENPSLGIKALKFADNGYQQTALLEYIYQRNYEREVDANHNLLAMQEFSDPSGNDWQRSALSIAGGHTLGHNSDYYFEAKPGSPLLALVCDGATQAQLGRQSLSGRGAARSLAEHFARVIESASETDLANEANAKEFVRSKIIDIGKAIFDEVNQSPHKLSDEVELNNLGDLEMCAGATLLAAIDIGDQVLLVSFGDSHIFALDKDSKLLRETVSQPLRESGDTCMFYYAIEGAGGEAMDPDYLDLGLRFRTVPKTLAKTIVLATDGVTTSSLDQNHIERLVQGGIQDGPQKIAANLVRQSLDQELDDKTAQVLVNQSI